MGQVCEMYVREVEAFAMQDRLMRSENTRLAASLSAAEDTAARARRSLDKLIATRSRSTFIKCGHPKDYGNTWTSPTTGKQSCRRCHRDREARRRRARRTGTLVA